MSASHNGATRARGPGLAVVSHIVDAEPSGYFAEVELELMMPSNALGAVRLVLSPVQCQALAAALTKVANSIAAKRV